MLEGVIVSLHWCLLPVIMLAFKKPKSKAWTAETQRHREKRSVC